MYFDNKDLLCTVIIMNICLILHIFRAMLIISRHSTLIIVRPQFLSYDNLKFDLTESFVIGQHCLFDAGIYLSILTIFASRVI